MERANENGFGFRLSHLFGRSLISCLFCYQIEKNATNLNQLTLYSDLAVKRFEKEGITFAFLANCAVQQEKEALPNVAESFGNITTTHC